LNASDEDAANYIRIFTLLTRQEIEEIERCHQEGPHMRALQKALAEDITIRVHGKEALEAAIAASNILFGKSTFEDLQKLSEDDFLAVFDGVPTFQLSKAEFEQGIGIVDALGNRTGFLASNGEARRELKSNAVSVNKEKVGEELVLNTSHLINDKYILLGKGKKNNYIIVVE
jgi:tyrosyl-tRNA synthetase